MLRRLKEQDFIIVMNEFVDCTLAREDFCPDLARTDGSEADPSVREHVQGCADCQSFFKIDLAMRERLLALHPQQAPGSLRGSLLKAMGRETAADMVPLFGSRITLPATILAMAAVLALLVVRAIPAPFPASGESPISAALIWEASHEKTGETNPQDLEAWFSSKFDSPVMVPEIEGGRLVGGGLANFHGHRSATVSYDFDGTRVTYMIIQSSNVLGRSISHGQGPHFIGESAGNENTVLWGIHDTARLLVGALPADQLMNIAERCRRQDLRGIRIRSPR